jgi:hypothetical protein
MFGGNLLGADGDVRRRRATQETLRAEILVHVWPMNSVSTTTNSPIRSLRCCRMQQPRIPNQRDGDRTAVNEVHAERVIREVDVSDSLARPRFRSTHSTLSGMRRSQKYVRTDIIRARALVEFVSLDTRPVPV